MKTPKKIKEQATEEVYPKLRAKKKTPEVELISYAMKMVIPTGNYANIQPEIIVRAGNIEDAHNYIAVHMNKLWKEYYLVGERQVVEKKVADPQQTPAPQPVPPPPASSVAFLKATQAIESCLSMEALELIVKQVHDSVKLSPEDKPKLVALAVARAEHLSIKTNE